MKKQNLLAGMLLSLAVSVAQAQSVGTDRIVSPASIGDAATDLVYVPITPCRIADTRVAGGVITGGNTRNFDVTSVGGTYAFQGGEATDCSGAANAGSWAAAAVNITVVSTAGTGFLTAYPFGATRPTAATMVFNGANDLRSNMSIIKMDQSAAANEMTVYASNQTHVVIDLIGYFINPVATALQCEDVAGTSTAVAAGNTGFGDMPSCSAGYTVTGQRCTSSSWDAPIVAMNSNSCAVKNNGSVSTNVTAFRTCCRVPGR